MNEPSKGSAKTIKLAERRVFSGSFKPLYQEGMGLVEQAAEYLDGKGRAEAKKLSRLAATLYAAESMRLTTRLMQVASWLLFVAASSTTAVVLMSSAVDGCSHPVAGWQRVRDLSPLWYRRRPAHL